MRLIDALPRTDEGNVFLPVAGVATDGGVEIELPGETTEEYIRVAYADFVELPVPLTQGDYEALLDASTAIWRRTWERWRSDGII